MDVILLQRIEKLGQMGEVVKVKPGFARNYLLPQRKAIRATESNRARFEQQRAQLEATNLERRRDAEAMAGKFEGLTVVLVRQAAENGQLYGSVSARDIADAVSEQGIKVERSQILMDRPIKTLGLHPVRIELHPEVIVSITANVAKSEEEAEAQMAPEAPSEEASAESEIPAESEPSAEDRADEGLTGGGPAGVST